MQGVPGVSNLKRADLCPPATPPTPLSCITRSLRFSDGLPSLLFSAKHGLHLATSASALAGGGEGGYHPAPVVALDRSQRGFGHPSRGGKGSGFAFFGPESATRSDGRTSTTKKAEIREPLRIVDFSRTETGRWAAQRRVLLVACVGQRKALHC